MKETIIAFVLIFLLVAVLNPLHLWMPTMMQMLILLGILVAFATFAIFILREKVSDEREGLHRMHAGRLAFLSGAAVLTLAIIVQGLQEALDGWLVVALVVMILAKIGAVIYSDRNN